MKYVVIVTPEAQDNISAAYGYIAARSVPNAIRWVRGLNKQIDRLETFPRGCGDARESAYFTAELRQLIYKSYRIVFTINDASQIVHVLYVRHAKRRAIGEVGDDESDD